MLYEVITPLEMTATRVNGPPDLAGHTAVGPTGSWTIGAPLAGAGALRSSVDDLLRFVAANLDSNIFWGNRSFFNDANLHGGQGGLVPASVHAGSEP